MTKKSLSVPDQHRRKIAIKTLQYSDIGALIMGGMTKQEAREFLKSIGENPAKYEAKNAHK